LAASDRFQSGLAPSNRFWSGLAPSNRFWSGLAPSDPATRVDGLRMDATIGSLAINSNEIQLGGSDREFASRWTWCWVEMIQTIDSKSNCFRQVGGVSLYILLFWGLSENRLVHIYAIRFRSVGSRLTLVSSNLLLAAVVYRYRCLPCIS
jgi:hypothetical protein